MTVQLRDANNGELMAISALEREGDVLVVRGKIYGSMPMNAYGGAQPVGFAEPETGAVSHQHAVPRTKPPAGNA